MTSTHVGPYGSADSPLGGPAAPDLAVFGAASTGSLRQTRPEEPIWRNLSRAAVIVVLGLLGGILASAAVSLAFPARYVAESQILLSPKVSGDGALPYGSGDYLEQRGRTYAAILGTEDFKARVMGTAGTQESTTFSGRSIPETTLVVVTATSKTRETARTDADAAATSLVDLVGTTESSVGGEGYIVATKVQAGGTSAVERSPSLALVWGSGPLAGVIVGLSVAYVVLSRRSRDLSRRGHA